LLAGLLHTVARRYRLPSIGAASATMPGPAAATALALTIEQARAALARGASPDEALQRHFIDTLAQMIRDAMRSDAGDPAFQAMVLRHRTMPVRDYASLSAHADKDRRAMHAAVNAIAHPARQQRTPDAHERDVLAKLHASANSRSWSHLHATVCDLLDAPEHAHEPRLQRSLIALRDHPALARLQRLDALASDERVQQYLSLLDRRGPRPGSATALTQGAASQQRGAAAEALAAQALDTLAQCLNDAAGEASYRVVTSMRVPASIPARHEHAKSEWDVVLLRHVNTIDSTRVWSICLLAEVKASLDAATTDFPRLLRGVRLLASAEADVVYPFDTREGNVHLDGAALRALTTDEAALAGTVLYCCDAPAETNPRLLSAASRMQLLSEPASVAFASALTDGAPADPRMLEPVWQQLLASPRWRAVLDQYPMLRQVRELMVHTDDLLAAIRHTGG
jgi:hypothetical protein